MRLAALAEQIKQVIEEAPPATWSGYIPGPSYIPGQQMQLKLALDPSEELKDEVGRIMVVPVVANYNRDESQGRMRVRKLSKNPTVAITLSIPFAEVDSGGLDVSSWEEISKVLNLREEIDEYIGLNVDHILSIEAEPPQELQLDKRWFLSITEVTFESFACS
jgi:hypothetical protein